MIQQASQYLFDQDVAPGSPLIIYGLITCGISLIISIVITFYITRIKSNNPGFLPKLSHILRTGAITWGILLFFLQQALFPFSMRIWAIGLLIPFTGWIYWHILAYRRTLPTLKQKQDLRHHYEQYLPKQRALKK